jgi:hypothetical protein
MRLLVISIVFFGLGAAAASAQTIPPPASPASLTTLRILPRTTSTVVISPHRQSLPQSREKEHDSAVADCMQMWDSGTHMTKQEWVRTCRRVQSRLDNLKIDGLIPETNSSVR